jgi:general secretion pathway protein D
MAGNMGYGNTMGYGGGYGTQFGGGYGYGYGQANQMAGVMAPSGTAAFTTTPGAVPTAGASPDRTGSYLGADTQAASGGARMPHVVPNPFDNTLIIQGTPQEWEQIQSLLHQLDVAPRQVLIDAKIYEVDLNDSLQYGVETCLEKVGVNQCGTATSGMAPSRTLAAAAGAAGLSLTSGALVFKSHELLALLNTSEIRGRSKVISAPSIIATDSIPATMNVGDQVPTLTSQAVAGGVQSSGSSVFTNTVSQQSSGVTLSVMARVNSSGVVTLIINQQVSAPIPPASNAAIQSPSFSNRSVSTQLTVQDGDTVAIGGIITETRTDGSQGVPFLHRIPVLGAAFGAKSNTVDRKELIIFFTPRVIYDTNQIADATDEIRSNLKRVGKMMKDQ